MEEIDIEIYLNRKKVNGYYNMSERNKNQKNLKKIL